MNRKGHTEDYFADFILGIGITIVAVWIFSFYYSGMDVEEVDNGVKDALEIDSALVSFLRSPIDSEKLNELRKELVLDDRCCFENMDIADAIILKSHVINEDLSAESWGSLIDYNILDKYIIDGLGRGYDLRINYPDGSSYNKQGDVKTFFEPDYVVYLPDFEGKKIKAELVII